MGFYTTEIPSSNRNASKSVKTGMSLEGQTTTEQRLEKLLQYTDCVKEFYIHTDETPIKNSRITLSNYPHCREKEIATTDSLGHCKINFSSVFLTGADTTDRDTLESVVAEYSSLVWFRSTSQERYGIPIGTLFEDGFSEIYIPDSHEKVLHIDRGRWDVKEMKFFFWSQSAGHFAYSEGNVSDEGFLTVPLIPGLSYFYVALALNSDGKQLMITPEVLYQDEDELNLSTSFQSNFSVKRPLSLNTWHLSPIRYSPYEEHVYPVSILDPRILHFLDKSLEVRDSVDIFYPFEDNDIIGEISSKYIMFFDELSPKYQRP